MEYLKLALRVWKRLLASKPKRRQFISPPFECSVSRGKQFSCALIDFVRFNLPKRRFWQYAFVVHGKLPWPMAKHFSWPLLCVRESMVSVARTRYRNTMKDAARRAVSYLHAQLCDTAEWISFEFWQSALWAKFEYHNARFRLRTILSDEGTIVPKRLSFMFKYQRPKYQQLWSWRKAYYNRI